MASQARLTVRTLVGRFGEFGQTVAEQSVVGADQEERVAVTVGVTR